MTNIAKGTVGLDVDVANLKSRLGELGSKGGIFDAFGGTAGLSFAAAFGVVVAGAGILYKIGGDIEEAHHTIQIATGATGTTLEGLNTDFANVAKNSVSSFADVATAVGGLNQHLGLTGAPLEKLSTQVTDLSRITKTDLAGNITAVSDVMNNWSVASGDQSSKLDELFAISQKTGISVGDLGSQMTTSGVAMRAAGLSFDESGALIGLLAKNGLSASTVIPALSKAMAVAAKEGKPAAQVFKDTFDAIKNAPDDTVAAGDALAVFGAKAGPKLAALIREGKISYDDFAASIAAGGTTIEDTAAKTEDWHQKLTKLGHNAAIALEPLATKVFGVLGSAVAAVTPYIEEFVAWFGKEAPKAVAFLSDEWDKYGQPIFDTIKKVIGDVVDWVIAHWPQISAVFAVVGDEIGSALGIAKDIIGKVWDGLKVAVGWLLDNKEFLVGIGVALGVMFAVWAAGAIAAAIATAAATIEFVAIGAVIAAVVGGVIYAYEHFKTFRDVIDAVGRFMRDTLWPIIKNVFNWLVDNVPPIIDKIVAVIAAMVGFVQRHWDTIVQIFTTAVAIVRGIIEAVVAVIEGIWDTFGNAISTYISGVWDLIKGIFQAAIDIIVGIFDFFRDLFTGKWGKLWGDVQAIFSGVWDAIKAYLDYIITTMEAVLQAAWDAIKLVASLAWDAIKGAITAVWDLLVAAVTAYIDTIKAVLSAAWDLIKTVASTAWDGIKTAITAPIDAASAAISAVWDGIKSTASTAWDAVKTAASTAWDGIKTAVMTPIYELKGALAAVWSDIQSAVETVWNAISSTVTGVIDGIKSAAKGIWDGISSGFTSALHPVVTALNTIISGADLIPGVNIPHIPNNFDVGGIVPGGGAQLAVVHSGEMFLTQGQQAQLFAIANGDPTATTAKTAPIVINNNRRDIGIGDLNQVLAMARLAS